MEGSRAPAVLVTIRWQSALPVRQAIARARFGAEVATSPDAAKLLGQTYNNYIVAVSGLPAQMLRRNPDQLKQAIQIKRKGKDAIMPVNLQADQPQSGPSTLYVMFPREQDGKPLIQIEDNEVEFLAKLGNVEIKRKFKLKDMVFDGKLEL